MKWYLGAVALGSVLVLAGVGALPKAPQKPASARTTAQASTAAPNPLPTAEPDRQAGPTAGESSTGQPAAEGSADSWVEVSEDSGPLQVISQTSVAHVIAVRPTGASLLESIEKPLVFRELNRGAGTYTYRLLDAEGAAVFEGAFELPELCPFADHPDSPHQRGHVLIEHETTLVLRVPALPAATQLELVRQVPLVDTAPRLLGTLPLRTP